MHFGLRLDFSEHYITAHNRCLLSIIVTPLSGFIVCRVSCGVEVTFYFIFSSPIASPIYMLQLCNAMTLIDHNIVRATRLFKPQLCLRLESPNQIWMLTAFISLTDSLRMRNVQQTQSSQPQPQSVYPAHGGPTVIDLGAITSWSWRPPLGRESRV